ncbi:MAG: DNA translocase FtsK, partial [Flavobacteriales bacterium]|nr:DNA translocase FtsK [Flavobacteriales bacterium]
EVHLAEDEEQLTEGEIDKKVQQFGEYDPKLDLSRFELPNIDLLVKHGDGKVKVSEAELTANKEKILETLRNFSIEVSSIKAEVGPTVTLYEIVPAPGIRISKIKNLEDDIALSLAALGIRIIAPIPGRGTIGIEVPNSNPDVVSMRTLIASDKFNNSKAALPIAIGKTISNETLVFDLAKMPHLLVAGATGQGKSVGLNAMLISLLYRKHPSQLKFVLVDPKKVELTLFNHIERHYLAKLPDSEEAIITDTSKVVATLNSLCSEMDQRYDLLKEAQCRNIAEYNTKFIRRRLNPEEGHKYLPYIVLVVDEFADLIMTAGKEVETPIARLAQLARAIGIHLIIATQRPSVNIITGTIKANFPARIAFRVTSKIDSRTILDAGGADQLIGRGDMLLSTGNELIRLQCGFVDTPEVEAICSFIGSQQGYPEAFLLPEYTEEGGASESGHISDDERDSMFYDAAKVIVMHQQGSTSLLQRKLKLGYNRAGRIIDQLESAGIIGPFEGSKARKVLVPDESSLEQILHKHDS